MKANKMCGQYELTKLQRRIAVLEATVAEHKKKCRAALERESLYRHLVEEAQDMIFVINRQDRVQYMNNFVAQHLGYLPEEIIGKEREKLFPPDIAQLQRTHLDKVFETGQPFYTEDKIPFQGIEIWLSAKLIPLKDKTGKVSAVMGIARDITKRKNMEDALYASEKKLRMHAKELKESNNALKVLLKQRENDKRELEEEILSNLKHLITPYIEKLKRNRKMSDELAYLNIIESNLREIVSPFSIHFSSKSLGLTPKEILIADLIKDGRQDKEIVDLLKISLDTVKSHRKNIRKKLGIVGKKTNLRTHLLSNSNS